MLNQKDHIQSRREVKSPLGVSPNVNPSKGSITTNSADMNSISPILYNNKKFGVASNFLLNPQGRDEKSLISEGTGNDNHYFMELDTPNTLAKNFYNNPDGNLITNQDMFFHKENRDPFLDSLNNCDAEEDEEQELVTVKKEMKSGNPKKVQNNFESEGTYSQFDLIAKEINSNKRGFSEKIRIKPVASGRQSESPLLADQKSIDTQVIKWAFSKDSQETQKKTISNFPQDMITKTLKSHDSINSNLQQQCTVQGQSAKNNHLQQNIKGKVLDFGTSEESSKKFGSQQLFGLVQGQNSTEKKFFLATDDSQFLKEEQQIISFIESEEDNLDTHNLISSLSKPLTSNSKQNINQNKGIFTQIGSKQGPVTIIEGVKFQLTKLAQVLQEIVINVQECQFCHEQMMYHSSMDCSKIEGIKSRKQIINENLNKKYLTSREYYNVKIINDVIYNENTHIVSVFKDYLIFDDVSEFLKRLYNKAEALQRLPRMYEFYEKYSKVFPNYVILPENKYMFKNIEKKQRLQDEKQRILAEQQQMKLDRDMNHSGEKNKNRHKDRFSQRQHQNSSSMSQLSNDRMFNTKFIDSVMNFQPSGFIDISVSSRINVSQYQEHLDNSAVLIHKQLKENMDQAKIKKNKKKGGALEDLDFDELISKFIAKDSESNIQQSQLQNESSEDMNNYKSVDPQQQPQKSQQLQLTSQNKKQIYNYTEKTEKSNALPQSSIGITEISKVESLGGRASSSKQKQTHLEKNRLSTGSAQQSDYPNLKAVSKNNIHYEDQKNSNQQSGTNKSKDQQAKAQKVINQELQGPNSLEEGKILNYNIYNNYNQYINNENYYISTDKDLPTNNVEQDLQNASKEPTQMMVISRPGSLSRVQSRSNLQLNSANSASSKVIPGVAALIKAPLSPHTPSKVTQVHREQKTPTSGSVGRRSQVHKQIKKQGIKPVEERQKGAEVQEQNECVSINDNKSLNSMQRLSNDPNLSPRSFLQRENISKIISSGKITQAINSNGLTSRDASKEKPLRHIISIQKPVLQTQGVALQPSSNKAEQSYKQINLKQKEYQRTNTAPHTLQQEQEIVGNGSHQQEPQVHSSNVRSVERLKLIEEEIEKDYSKYQNEYGLTKTAFAKAVNAIREKTLQQQQQIMSETKEIIKNQNSNEKGRRGGSNTQRAGSNSQSRKQAPSKNLKQVNSNSESVNDLYMNTNSVRQVQDPSKNIRSIRAKTHMNSQNSSGCYNQISQKMSPDKMQISSNPLQLNTIHSMMQFSQSEVPSSKQSMNPQQNFLTLKAQPNQASKSIKIKFPINQQSSRGNSIKNTLQKNNNNQSQNQTPKRLKLQKTRSTSNLGFNQKMMPTQQSQNVFTHRGRVPELGILEQMSHYNQHLSASQKDILSQISSLGLNPHQLTQLNDFNMQSIDCGSQSNLICPQQLQHQYPFVNSCGGTYATTSILNSPLSYKQQSVTQKNSSKQGTERATSRNGNQSQHQSQKSINLNQRASSNASTNLFIGNNSKVKPNKRMSAGSNQLKPSQSKQNLIPSPVPSTTINNQLIQLLLTCQNQQLDSDLGSTSSLIGKNLSQANFSQTLKSLQQSAVNGQQSMKNLKSLKSSTTNLMKDVQVIKQNKLKPNSGVGSLISQQSVSHQNQSQQNYNFTGQTQRLMSTQPTILGQILKNKSVSKSGKSTSRADSKKGQPTTFQIQQQLNNEQSQRYGSVLGMSNSNIGDSTAFGGQDSKKLMNYSKSHESLDLIKMIAQKTAQDQYQQLQQEQMQQKNQQYASNLSTQNFQNSLSQNQQQQYQMNMNSQKMQNQKQSSTGENQILFQKIKKLQQNQSPLTPQLDQATQIQYSNQYNHNQQQILSQLQPQLNTNHYQQPPNLQSVKNLQFSVQSGNNFGGQFGSQPQFGFKAGDYEGVSHSTKTPTTIILPSASDKPQSRRTSSKFNPQSTKNN